MAKWLRDHLLTWRAAGVLAVVVVLVWLAGRGLPDGRLHVYFLDVGQGQAVFIRTPDGRQLLIDGGPSPQALFAQLSAVMPFWDHSLDLVALTHPDEDHQAGLLAALERYRVTQVLDAVAPADPAGDAWRGATALARAARVPGERGTRLAAGPVLLTVLHPGPTRLAGTPADDNNNSLVLRLDYGQTGLLLAGDAEAEAEAEMLAQGLPLRADVLQAGHHGSRRSSTPAFLAAIAPRLAVIQLGSGNRYGHPHAEVLQRLAPATVLRTDQHGRIEVISDGRSVWVQTAR